MSGKETDNAPARARQRVEMTPEVIDAMMHEIAGGKSLVKVCEMPGMPGRTAFLRRVSEDAALQVLYATAMQARADKYAEETIDIADDGANDTYIDGEGMPRTDTDVIARSKLRVSARQWYASKIAPKKYGDKLALGGADDLPPIQMNDTEAATKLAAIIAAGLARKAGAADDLV